MGRRTKDLVIEAEGRDKGKRYTLTEMTAVKGERWARRVVIAVAKGVEGAASTSFNSKLDADDGMVGLAGVIASGTVSLKNMDDGELDPLMQEMMTCVTVYPDPRNPHVARPFSETQDDIDELSTLVLVRREILELHLGFTLLGKLSTWVADMKSLALSRVAPQTSPGTSPQS